MLSTRLLPVEDLLIAQDPQGILLALMVVGHIPLILRIEMKLRMGMRSSHLILCAINWFKGFELVRDVDFVHIGLKYVLNVLEKLY